MKDTDNSEAEALIALIHQRSKSMYRMASEVRRWSAQLESLLRSDTQEDTNDKNT